MGTEGREDALDPHPTPESQRMADGAGEESRKWLERCNAILFREIRSPVILVVDDIPANIELLAQLLEEYDVLAATNGRDALELARSEMPDLILLDVMMPEMDGYAVCRQLKADPVTNKIPIIFVTALKDEANEQRGLQLGAIDYITKPYSEAIILARVRNHLALKRSTDMLELQSLMDGLTGTANRRRFDAYLEQEWRRGVRSRRSLGLLMLDVDFFKQYNDHFGHLAGDDCLRHVACVISETVYRAADLTARYGGEEFACVLPETDAQGAVEVGRRIVRAIDDLHMPHPRSGIAGHVTISCGAAALIPEANLRSVALVDLADRKLYQAKQQGRNRVVWDE